MARIISKRNVGYENVYDIEVQDNHNFIANGVVVHNCTNAGSQNLFRLVAPDSIEEISAITAIYRPGPLAMGIDKAYVKTKRNPNLITYDHPSLEPILKDTFGHIVYQEQVMRIVNEVAGIPMDECNSIRKMMKPQQSSAEAVKKAKALEDRIVGGFRNHGLSQAQANTLYSKIMKFTQYSFNKSHSLSYAILSYQCAYMMAYHEEQWLCAYLENMSSKPEDKNKALAEVKSLGYKIVPLDINHAHREWTILPGKQFMPSFGSIKGVGDTAIDEIIRNRPYTDLDSIMYNDAKVWKLSKFNKRSFEALVKVKAFESMGIVGPGKLFENYNHMLSITSEWAKFKKRLKKDAMAGYNLLYETIETNRGINDFTRKELVLNEKSHLGSVNIETLIPKRFYSRFEDEGWESIDDWSSDKKPCWFIVESVLKKKTKTGKPYLRLKTSGSTGKQYWMNCWNWNGHEELEAYTVCVGFISKSDYGMSCRWNKMEIFVE